MEREVVIRLAKREEMKDVRDMIQELANFEKMPNGPKISATDLMRDGYGARPLFRCFVAELPDESTSNASGSQLVAYAMVFDSYSAWQGKFLFLEDFYVKPKFRGLGVGKRIFTFIVKLAYTEGSSWLELHVLSWNPARKFYEKMGLRNLTESEGWMYYRLDEEAVEKLGCL